MNALLIALSLFVSEPEYHIRVNQMGYTPGDQKVAVIFSKSRIRGKFSLIDSEGTTLLSARPTLSNVGGWGAFSYYYEFDFSAIKKEGSFTLAGPKSTVKTSIKISSTAYQYQAESLLEFMRQQRCGYNPFLDIVCHEKDGRSAYGTMQDGTFVNASGGWHDAGDQLKYLITSSYATGHMLMAYELYPEQFEDKHNHLGQPGANGIPDVLDEAKWGLDWILKLHTDPKQLIHQVADDRDHRGWKMPDNDISDYGWGQNSYRVAYFATGEPQGLNKYKSEATGVSNVAGRSAAAMALASRIWKNSLNDSINSELFLRAARTLYALGREKEGYQQGNSYGAPYRYNEETWEDDMEWGAAELYKSTGETPYLEQAKKYALEANTEGWTTRDSASHYQFYPFVNLGHFALYDQVDSEFKETLASYYKEGLEYTKKRAETNPFNIGVPFIWCSNNLLTSLITQGILYEKMTGDSSYSSFIEEQRDWLFGRNPWGTSMFTGMPQGGEYPLDVHTSVWAMTQKEVPGGLVDGPVYGTIYSTLKGLVLNEPDEFAGVQNKYVVYHDDIGDYSTNEPTMDGTAGSILLFAHFAKK